MDNPFNHPRIRIYTKILRHRVARVGLINFNFIDPNRVFSSPKLDDHLGRHVGWFSISNGRPAVVMIARQVAWEDVSHIFLIRVNPVDKAFPLDEQVRLMRDLRSNPQFVAVNILSSTPGHLELPVLLESVRSILARDIFNAPPILTARVSGAGSFKRPLCEEVRKPSPCSHVSDPKLSTNIKELLKANNVSIGDLSASSPFFDVFRSQIDGHWLYGVAYRGDRAVMFIVPRISEGPSAIQLETLRDHLKTKFPGLADDYHVTRFRFDVSCDDQILMKACILLTRVPLLYVDRSDLDLALEDLDILSIGGSQGLEVTMTTPPLQRRRMANYPSANESVDLVWDDLGGWPASAVILSDDGRREEPLRSQAVIRGEVSAYQSWLRAGVNLGDYPSASIVKPRAVENSTILVEEGWLLEQLPVVLTFWEPYSSVKLLQCVSSEALNCHHLEDKIERFIILPVRHEAHSATLGLMIFDKERSTWGWLHPDNDAASSCSLLNAIRGALTNFAPRYANWPGKIIILTSYYHTEYPYVHILMGLYHIARLFAYSCELPAKVVYKEQVFRSFAYLQCLALQVANLDYNLDNNLVKDDGELSPEALVSLPSPVQFQRAVVPTDLCGFCKRRGFSNLGRHMMMKHGRQAHHANLIRRIQNGMADQQDGGSEASE